MQTQKVREQQPVNQQDQYIERLRTIAATIIYDSKIFHILTIGHIIDRVLECDDIMAHLCGHYEFDNEPVCLALDDLICQCEKRSMTDSIKTIRYEIQKFNRLIAA